MADHYDTIIIGAGLAGLTAGALLSAEEKQKVLILEREPYLGGRLLSFSVEEGKFKLHGQSLGVPEYKKALASVYAWVTRAEPDLETMLEKGLLNGYSFEAGGHATFWGTKGRVGFLLDYLNKKVNLPGNEGFSVIDPEQVALFPVEKGGRYGWMSDDENKIAKSLLREMAMAGPDTLAEWDRISFGQWLRDRTGNRRVYEFLAAVASIHMVMGEPDMIPAGDFIRFMRTAVEIGMNLVSGSTGIVPKPGFIYIGERIAEKVTESGGEIVNNAKVLDVLFDNGRVTGVKADMAGTEMVYSADSVVCTVPIRKLWSFIPKKKFLPEFVARVENDFFSVGMLTGYIGLKSDPLADAGINPKSWLLVPAILKSEEGFIGDVDIISIMPGNFESSLAPEGKYSIAYSIALTEGELRDKAKVDRVIDVSRDLFHRIFPKMKKDTLWEIWTCSDKGFGDWPPPGERRPDTTQPNMSGLFFAGDGYGAKTWGSGMDAAVYSGLLAVDAITGKNYVEKVMPPYHR
jgi:hypothetical protein